MLICECSESMFAIIIRLLSILLLLIFLLIFSVRNPRLSTLRLPGFTLLCVNRETVLFRVFWIRLLVMLALLASLILLLVLTAIRLLSTSTSALCLIILLKKYRAARRLLVSIARPIFIKEIRNKCFQIRSLINAKC